MFRRNFCVEILENQGQGKQAWEVIKRGSPGDVEAFEEWLYDSEEMIESVKCMAVNIRVTKEANVGRTEINKEKIFLK